MLASTKPKQRAALAEIVEMLRGKNPDPLRAATMIEIVLKQMHNRVSPRARTTSVQITPEVREHIRSLRRNDRRLPQHEIGRLVGTNQGRVSETLSGKRV